MSLQIAKLGMSKNIRTRDGARHFVTKITLPKASDVTPLPLEKNSAVLGDLEKWSSNHWGGGLPLSPPVAAPLLMKYKCNCQLFPQPIPEYFYGPATVSSCPQPVRVQNWGALPRKIFVSLAKNFAFLSIFFWLRA